MAKPKKFDLSHPQYDHLGPFKDVIDEGHYCLEEIDLGLDPIEAKQLAGDEKAEREDGYGSAGLFGYDA